MDVLLGVFVIAAIIFAWGLMVGTWIPREWTGSNKPKQRRAREPECAERDQDDRAPYSGDSWRPGGRPNDELEDA